MKRYRTITLVMVAIAAGGAWLVWSNFDDRADSASGTIPVVERHSDRMLSVLVSRDGRGQWRVDSRVPTPVETQEIWNRLSDPEFIWKKSWGPEEMRVVSEVMSPPPSSSSEWGTVTQADTDVARSAFLGGVATVARLRTGGVSRDDAAALVKLLTDLAGHNSPHVRHSAVTLLSMAGLFTVPKIRSLAVRLERDSEPEVAAQAHRALRNLNDPDWLSECSRSWVIREKVLTGP